MKNVGVVCAISSELLPFFSEKINLLGAGVYVYASTRSLSICLSFSSLKKKTWQKFKKLGSTS